MTKTIFILAIAAAFVAGSILAGTMAFAQDDENENSFLSTEINNMNILLADLNQKSVENHSQLLEKIENVYNDQIVSNAISFRQATISVVIIAAIAVIIFLVTNMQSTKIEKLVTSNNSLSKGLAKLTDEDHKVVTKQETTRKEIQGDISFILKKKLYFVKKDLEHSLNLYEKYKIEPDSETKKNYLTHTMDAFDRCYAHLDVKLDLLKLIEIYGRATARQYWELLADLENNSKLFFFRDDFEEELSSFMYHAKYCLEKTKELKNIIDPLASPTIKPKSPPSSHTEMSKILKNNLQSYFLTHK